MEVLTLDKNACIGVELEGFNLNPNNFQKLTIIEKSGMILPIFELQLIQPGFQLLSSLRKMNTPISISYGVDLTSAREYEFSILNYNYVNDGSDGRFTLILSGILQTKGFTDTPRIRSIRGTSDQVFNSIESVNSVDVNYTGDDEQVWIQHNNSDKNFVERVLSHSYSEPNNCILGSITVDKELIVTSVKDQFGTEPKIHVGNSEEGSFSPEDIRVESDSALWSSFFSEGRPLSILQVKDREIKHYSSSMDSIVDNESNSDITENVPYPIQLDCGNCHDNYYQAYIDNLSYPIQLSRNNIYVTTSKQFFNNDQLKIHDIVRYDSGSNELNQPADSMAGDYILTEKYTILEGNKFSHRLRLCRDYTL